ncbi:MAG TPA: protein tyrosine phosphatase family protein [Rhodothermales bacterium]|nr:protein tyrosine phosphatase family protein [Rhodothermales bacterium]
MPKPLRFFFLIGLVVTLGTLPASAQSAEEDLATVYNYLKISDDLSTSGQIAYDQIASLKEAGFEVVVNLAPASDGANALEGFLVTQQGLSYVQIPVSWQEPSLRDLQMFFDVMEANKDHKVYVHCFANMRVSAFVYLYRTLMLDIPDDQASADLNKIWDPLELEQWAGLIERAKQQSF